MRHRRAISLIELLAVLTGCSIILGLTASLLHQTMRAQSHTRDFFTVERNALRLSRQFRADVHAAAANSIDVVADDAGDGALLRLQLPAGEVVEYLRVAEKIIRLTSPEDGTTAREEYTLSEAMAVTVREVDAPERYLLSITSLASPPSTDTPPSAGDVRATPINLEVEATPARDLRYSAASTSSEEAT